MAYGRMVARTIATDPQIRKLSDKAAFLYLCMIPFLDRQGKFYAQVNTVKGMIVPFRKSFTAQVVGSCLREMEKNGLVKIYGEEREYIIFKGFLKNNSVHKNEAPSVIPDPDYGEITSKLPEIGSRNRIELNRKELNRIECEKQPKNPSTLLLTKEAKHFDYLKPSFIKKL